jgi:sarcosine oxidase subunit gamma
MTDDEGYLINQKELSCFEICDKAIAIFRSSKDIKQSRKIAKESWGLELPAVLGISDGDDGMQCFWISPDEYWIIHPRFQRDAFWQKSINLENNMSLVDNSGAYGALRFSGNNVGKLLSRWMGYDIYGKLENGKVVSTTLGQAPVVAYRENDHELMLLVRHSFSHYVAGLLTDSAKRL